MRRTPHPRWRKGQESNLQGLRSLRLQRSAVATSASPSSYQLPVAAEIVFQPPSTLQDVVGDHSILHANGPALVSAHP